MGTINSLFRSRLLLFRLCVFILLFIGFTVPVHAQFEEGKETNPLSKLTGSEIVTGATASQTFTAGSEVSHKLRNSVTLSINELSTIQFKTGFIARLYLKIERKEFSSSAVDTLYRSVMVNYDTTSGSKYKARATILLPSSEYVKLTVDTVSITGYTGWAPLNVLVLSNEVRVLRYYNLATTLSNLTPTTIDTSWRSGDAIKVKWTWPAATGQNMSQLEWAWVEDEMAAFYNTSGSFDADKLFNNNRTRVDLPYLQDSVFIPLLYDGVGKLYFRIRPCLRKNDGNVLAGPWTTARSIHFKGHSDSLNWQSSTSFAEGGKMKTVVQYFDGTLRSRQTVTKDYETGNTLVGETIYDLQGRPNLQILPTPTSDNILRFMPGFNRFKVGSSAQSINDDPTRYFDLTLAASKCGIGPKLLDTSGNGKYYSPNNPWLASETKSKYIPNANGYAYTETRYMDDATQRVQVQGGVDSVFQIGSGRETKYYYGKPAQQELDALFGTEAGDAAHYFKNMVQDANGQMSVSYVDMHGRTIATALAGAAVINVGISDDTKFYPAVDSLKYPLLTPSSNIIRNGAIESVSTMLMSSDTKVRFTYSLNPSVLSLLSCSGTPICFDCKYDLEISIRSEDCSADAPHIRRFNNLSLIPADSACGKSAGFRGDGMGYRDTTIQFLDTLKKGSWVIRKTLTINDSAYKSRLDSALKVFLCRSQQHLYDSIYTVLASKCAAAQDTAAACDSCLANLGTYNSYRTKYLLSISADTAGHGLDASIRNQFISDSMHCVAACSPIGLAPEMATLESMRRQMLEDMIPYSGQYAKDSIRLADGTVDSTLLEKRWNIFITTATNPLFSQRPFFRYPRNAVGVLDKYRLEEGQVDSAIHSSWAGPSLLDTIAPNEYVSMFQRSWAKSLIVYHPEYTKLKFAEDTLRPAFEWIDSLRSVDNWSTALARHWDDPRAQDPYLLGTYHGSGDVAAMNAHFNPSGQISFWQLANGSQLCSTLDGPAKAACYTAQPDAMKTGVSSDTKDSIWQAFRDLYLSTRYELMMAYINAKPHVLQQADMDQLVAGGHYLTFAAAHDVAGAAGGGSWWDNVTTGDTSGTGVFLDTAGNHVTSIDYCVGQKPFWKTRLLQCDSLQHLLLSDSVSAAALIESILNGMVEICHASATPQNPAGASTLPPGATATFSSFEALVNHVLDSAGIHTIPGNRYFCNPFSVDYPTPYGTNPPLSVNWNNQVDSCGCKRFHELKLEAAATTDTTSMSAMNVWLKVNYNDTLSSLLWSGLQQCNNLYRWNCGVTVTPGGSSSCPRPLITSIQVTGGSNPKTVSFGYHFPTGSTGCHYTMIDSSGDYSHGGSLTCDSIYFSHETKVNCNPWKLVLSADSLTSGCVPVTSDTLIFEICDSINCTPVYQPILLGGVTIFPAFLNCGYVKPCITCGHLDSLISEFHSLYPTYDSVPYFDPQVDSHYSRNALWARFMNFRTGISKTANDYIAAKLRCDSLHTPSLTAICGSDRPVSDTTGYVHADDPCSGVPNQAATIAAYLFNLQKDSLVRVFDSSYKAMCYSAQGREQFFAKYVPTEYHYTLYFYDQAGNLVKTLPPAAVRPNYNSTWLGSVTSARASGDTAYNHKHLESLATQYRYNSLNQVVQQNSPDAGTSRFFYDRLGRLAASQNAKQASEAHYSYTKYDLLGRIVEVGQVDHSTDPTSRDTAALAVWLNAPTGQITGTVYDTAYTPLQMVLGSQSGLFQQNLRNRVSYTYVKSVDTLDVWDAATFYSYDIHGNVDTLLQDFRTGLGSISCLADSTSKSGNRFKKVVYNYDLISGKVNSVAYQAGQRDQFYHRYGYDAENRLTIVETSRDSIYWERDAAYNYYRHGPLSRSTIGQLQVQGIDYAYTIQGWLKGVNSTKVGDGSVDMGRDGNSGSLVARDVFGYALHYFSTFTAKDYTPVSSSVTAPFADPAISKTSNSFTPLYNGNIAAMSVNLPKVGGAMLYTYRYDQLNRISSMTPFIPDITSTNTYSTSGTVVTDDYKESGIKYDPNGNILAYTRNGSASAGTPLAMDQLTYWYYYYTSTGVRKQYNPQSGIPSDAYRLTNQLASVKDTVNKDNYTRLEGTEDVDNMPDSSYRYDAIGNMIENKGDSVLEVGWNVYGKISYLTKRRDGVNQTIVYKYDASGNRISKSVGTGKTTYYVRDAQGNVLSTYEYKAADTLRQTEINLYGSSRLGVLSVRQDMQDCSLPPTDTLAFMRGYKQYELSNHLGNVLATVSDRHFGKDTNSNDTSDYYIAEVITEQDYYPFGMQMPGRKYPSYQPPAPSGGGSPASPIELYRHSFTTAASGSPYTALPGTQSAYIDSSKWTSSTGSFTGYAVPGSAGDTCLGIATSPTGGSSYYLTLNVQPGYRLTLTSTSFSTRISSPSGYPKWRFSVNGTEMAVFGVINNMTMSATGTKTLSPIATGLTGLVTVRLWLLGSAADTCQFMLDNFVLNGFVQLIPTSANIGQGASGTELYKYGFNGQERDREVGEDNYGALYWEYDSRIGRRWNLDPKLSLPISPYSTFGNNPIFITDPRGDSLVPLTTYDLRNIARAAGISSVGVNFNRQVGKIFERIAIAHQGFPSENTEQFPSEERLANTGSSSYVIPDAVRAVWKTSLDFRWPPIKEEVFFASSFFEVKAVSGIIRLSSSNYQIQGELDALKNSEAGRERIATMTFITTTNTVIAPDVVNYAAKNNLKLYQVLTFRETKDNSIHFSAPIPLSIPRNRTGQTVDISLARMSVDLSFGYMFNKTWLRPENPLKPESDQDEVK